MGSVEKVHNWNSPNMPHEFEMNELCFSVKKTFREL